MFHKNSPGALSVNILCWYPLFIKIQFRR